MSDVVVFNSVTLDGMLQAPGRLDEAGCPVTAVALPARGRPPQAAARRAGLEFVEKLLTRNLISAVTSDHDTGSRQSERVRSPLMDVRQRVLLG